MAPILCCSLALILLFEGPSVMRGRVICLSVAVELLEFLGDLSACREVWLCELMPNSLNLSVIYCELSDRPLSVSGDRT